MIGNSTVLLRRPSTYERSFPEQVSLTHLCIFYWLYLTLRQQNYNFSYTSCVPICARTCSKTRPVYASTQFFRDLSGNHLGKVPGHFTVPLDCVYIQLNIFKPVISCRFSSAVASTSFRVTSFIRSLNWRNRRRNVRCVYGRANAIFVP